MDQELLLNTQKRIRLLGYAEHPYESYRDERYFVFVEEHKSLYQRLMKFSLSDQGGRIALISGGPGTGKTTISKLVANGCQAIHSSLVGVRIEKEPLSPTSFIRYLNEALDLPAKRSSEDRIHLLCNLLENLANINGRLLVVVDSELDASVFESAEQILALKHSANAQELPIKFVFFSKSDFGAIEQDFPHLTEQVEIRDSLGGLTNSGASTLLENRSVIAGRNSHIFINDALLEIIDQSNGNPRALVTLAKAALDLLLDSNENMISLDIVEAAVNSSIQPNNQSL